MVQPPAPRPSSDSNGAIVLHGFFDSATRFRATMDGHETLTQTWTCSVPQCQNNARPWLGFYVRPLAPPVDLAGDYTLTITAAVDVFSIAGGIALAQLSRDADRADTRGHGRRAWVQRPAAQQ